MTRARQLAMERAVAALGIPVEYLLLDAFDVPESPLPQLAVVKGDRTCASIMAASVVAKVHRDLQMIEFDGMYPGYGFALHKGYATAAHQEAIRFLGPSAIHRTSWRRVRELAAGGPVAEVVEVDEIANPSPRGGGGGKGFARPALGGFPPSLERAR
jgi:ribonuclease HII